MMSKLDKQRKNLSANQGVLWAEPLPSAQRAASVALAAGDEDAGGHGKLSRFCLSELSDE